MSLTYDLSYLICLNSFSQKNHIFPELLVELTEPVVEFSLLRK